MQSQAEIILANQNRIDDLETYEKRKSRTKKKRKKYKEDKTVFLEKMKIWQKLFQCFRNLMYGSVMYGRKYHYCKVG